MMWPRVKYNNFRTEPRFATNIWLYLTMVIIVLWTFVSNKLHDDDDKDTVAVER